MRSHLIHVTCTHTPITLISQRLQVNTVYATQHNITEDITTQHNTGQEMTGQGLFFRRMSNDDSKIEEAQINVSKYHN